jgi:hypothetical protein
MNEDAHKVSKLREFMMKNKIRFVNPNYNQDLTQTRELLGLPAGREVTPILPTFVTEVQFNTIHKDIGALTTPELDDLVKQWYPKGIGPSPQMTAAYLTK